MAAGKAGTVEVAFRLLDVLAEAGEGVALGAAVDRVGVPAATVHRIFQSLAVLGYVRQDHATRSYELGPGMIRVGAAAGRMFGSWARAHLTKLAHETGETATLSVLDGRDVSVVAFSQPSHGLQVRMRLGRHDPAHTCADGKVLLSQLSDEEVRRLWGPEPLLRRTDRTVTDPSLLLDQLCQIRATGYACDDGESEPGAAALAVPVTMRWPTAVTLSGPSTRIAARVEELVPLLQTTSQELNAAMRRRGPETLWMSPAASPRNGSPPHAS